MRGISEKLQRRNRIEDCRLADLTTMRVGGPCRLVLLEDPRDLPELREYGCRWLGKGANIVAGEAPCPALLVRLGVAFGELAIKPIDASRAKVVAGAAVDLAVLIGRCCDAGLVGPAGLAGVPATVGGALRMNAGTAHCWLGDFVDRVQVVLPDEEEPRWLASGEYTPAYRDGGLPEGTLYLGCELRLAVGDPDEQRERARTLKRRKATSQPLAARSAGCIFKNPEPELPAGRLIDELGCKEWSCGTARVSPIHANFIVNEGEASGDEVFTLIKRIRRRAWRERGVVLEVEVRTWQAPEDLHAHPEELSDD